MRSKVGQHILRNLKRLGHLVFSVLYINYLSFQYWQNNCHLQWNGDLSLCKVLSKFNLNVSVVSNNTVIDYKEESHSLKMRTKVDAILKCRSWYIVKNTLKILKLYKDLIILSRIYSTKIYTQEKGFNVIQYCNCRPLCFQDRLQWTLIK